MTYSPTNTFTNGQRVELHPGTNPWMQGDRYGEVKGTQDNGLVSVKLDKSGKVLNLPPELLRSV